MQRTGRRLRAPKPRKFWMVTHYPRPPPVSSEKHETASAAGAEARGRGTSNRGTATVLMGYGGPRSERLTVVIRASAHHSREMRTLARWC
jgi:hypothetical protein